MKFPPMICSIMLMLFFVAAIGTPFPLQGQDCYELVWSDEFNTDGLPDSSNWSYEVGAGGWGNNEWQYYTNKRTDNARIENGSLIIEARKESYQGSNYTSARLISYRNKKYWKYGKIEARIKLPYGKGIWPACWMMGRGIFEGTSWPACGETDIVELIGGGEGFDDKAYGTAHWADASGNHAQYGGSYQLATGIFADTFHVFTVQWTATDIRWYVDGVQYQIIDIKPSALSEFHQEFFLILNLAVGGNWPGYPDATTVFPQQMKVDYIRVYQLNATPLITGDNRVVKGMKNVQFSVPGLDEYTYEWSVPADVQITAGQGTHSIRADWGCDSGTVGCTLTTGCKEYRLQIHIDTDSMEITGKDKVSEFQTNIAYAVPPTRDAVYKWILPEGVTFNGDSDTNQVYLNWTDRDDVLTLNLTDYCGTDSLIKRIGIIKQLPYPDPGVPHKIPGILYSVNFDSGGEGVAYHDASAGNEGSGSRQDEGVDTESNDGGENIGWTAAGEWLEYTVDVTYSGTYDIEFRVASTNNNGRFALLLNGETRTGTLSVPSTGAWNAFTSVIVQDIPVAMSDTLLRIEIINGEFNLGRMTFADSLAVTLHSTGYDRLIIYPAIATHDIYIENLNAGLCFSLYDIRGGKAGTGFIFPGESIDITDLSPGIYILRLTGPGIQEQGKFVKISRINP